MSPRGQVGTELIPRVEEGPGLYLHVVDMRQRGLEHRINGERWRDHGQLHREYTRGVAFVLEDVWAAAQYAQQAIERVREAFGRMARRKSRRINEHIRAMQAPVSVGFTSEPSHSPFGPVSPSIRQVIDDFRKVLMRLSNVPKPKRKPAPYPVPVHRTVHHQPKGRQVPINERYLSYCATLIGAH